MAGDDRGGSLGLWGVVAIGVGGMVGGGIFAVLGLTVELSRGGAPIAFAIAGTVALVTALSYARLSVAFPSRGGTVAYLNEAFGTGVSVGGLNVLLWLSYVVMLSLYASAFGGYLAGLVGADAPTWVQHAALSGVILAVTALNVADAEAIGRAEEWIVGAKLVILVGFVAVGVGGVTWGRLSPSTWSSTPSLVGGGMLIFVAYEGFELIANAAEDVRDPARVLPRAFTIAVVGVIALYVAIAGVTVGSLSLDRIGAASEYALAEAARPALGQAGFTIIAVAALLSTMSAINATLYGSARLSYTIARSGELPETLTRKVWGKPIEGLLVTSAVTLVVANVFDLSAISTMGSAGFLVVFAAANAAAYRLHERIGGHRVRSAAGIVLCLVALGALAAKVAPSDPVAAGVAGALVAGSFAIEAAYRVATRRSLSDRLARPDEAGEAHGS